MSELIALATELVQLNDENLAERVLQTNDVQWCLEELCDILEAQEHAQKLDGGLTAKSRRM